MALGSGEGANIGRPPADATLYLRSRRVVTNRFDYIQPRDPIAYAVAEDPSGVSPLALLQPKVPITRAEKERARCAFLFVQTAVDLASPPVPMRARVQWTQSQAQSPLFLTTARSRTDLLSERRARGG